MLRFGTIHLWRLDARALMVPDKCGGRPACCRESKGLYLKLERAGGVLSLLYAAGDRPTANDVARLLDEPEPAGQKARISHQPDGDDGWLELLASGLTFDIAGLAPTAPKLPQPAAHLFGLSANTRNVALEAVTLTAGGHLAPGSAMLPVVKVMCGLGARLASLGNVRAIAWQPAESWMEPGYFTRIIASWMAGGAFPALGLTALERTDDGGLESQGLAFFSGQELRIEAREGEPSASTAKLAVRMIDLLVRQGRISESSVIPGPEGEELLAEPTFSGDVVRVWRGA